MSFERDRHAGATGRRASTQKTTGDLKVWMFPTDGSREPGFRVRPAPFRCPAIGARPADLQAVLLMGKLATLIGPALIAGVLLSCLIATPASALELAMGGTFYVSVLEGECPQPIDLWGVGPGRNPLFLGHYQGR